MKVIVALCCSVFFLPVSTALAVEAPASNITISAPTEVPGMTLQPGTYSIRVVGKLTDRVILKIDDGRGNKSVDFLGIPNHAVKASPGIVSWSQPIHGTTYLRGWVAPGTPFMIEFVYPKEEALSIATSNQEKVPAIDPASDGRSADPTLSREDMKLVTLWLLSSTRVGPADQKPFIKAERYQTASYVQPRPALSTMPHTASFLPIILLSSLFSLAMAILLRWRRLASLNPENHF
jgi:hypothetical protein